MELFINTMFNTMLEEINFIQLENESALNKLDRIIPLIQKKVIELKTYFLECIELTEQQEIHFFKHQKTKFNALLIYYIELYNFEIKKPVENSEESKLFIKNQIQKLYLHKEQNIDFYTYLKSNMTYCDSTYFTRNNFDFRTKLNPHCFESDPCFSTSHDYLTAIFSANDRLMTHYQNLLNQEERNPDTWSTLKTNQTELKWTSSKSNLIELIYAIQQTGCFNNGNTDIKQIAALFSEIFDVNLGDFYRTYLDLKARNTRTKFLDQLRNNLENKMIDDDL